MSKYTTNTSDKKKKTALIWWAIGAIGILGIENFYVGKMKNGAIRVGTGILILVCFYAMSTLENFDGAIPVGIIFWAIVALPNLFKILFGVFRDNVGAALRE